MSVPTWPRSRCSCLIRRSDRRPPLPMGAGLCCARRCCRPRPIFSRRWSRPRRASPPPGSRSADPRDARRPRRRRRGVRRGARRRPRGLSRRAAASGAARRRRGDAGDDRTLCAPAVRSARAGVRRALVRAAATIAARNCCSTRGAMPADGQPPRFGSVLDLGCGTGLGRRGVPAICDWLVGVDLSPGMIEQARAKGIYDRLDVVRADRVPRLQPNWRAASPRAGGRCLRLLRDLAPIATAVAARAGAGRPVRLHASRPTREPGVVLQRDAALRPRRRPCPRRAIAAPASISLRLDAGHPPAPRRARRCPACWSRSPRPPPASPRPS